VVGDYGGNLKDLAGTSHSTDDVCVKIARALNGRVGTGK